MIVPLFVTLALCCQAPELQTVAERSGYKATATSAQVAELAKAIDGRSDAVSLGSLGTSHEGKALPLLLLSDPPIADAAAAKKSGKLVVLLFGNIHAGEVDAKEALLILARELSQPAPHPLLKDLIVAIVPNFNPDGNDKMAKTNRPGQVGPEDGMGRRENGQGLDLNRDFIKLDAPETRALVAWINEWDPHVVVDGHTTNGSHHRFTITHAGPKAPAGDRRVIDYANDRLLKEVGEVLQRDSGWKSFPYGNFNREHDRWSTFAPEPRYSTNYVGLRNRIGILSESYSYATYRDRVLATRDFCKAILTFAAAQKDEIKRLLNETAQGGAVGQDVAVRSEPRARSQPAVALGFVEKEEDGRRVATAETKDYTVQLWDDFVAKETVKRPEAYLVPSAFSSAIATLKRHGLPVTTLREDITLDVEAYRVDAIKRAERPYQGHTAVDLSVTARPESRMVAAGTVIVPATGPLGPLAVMLLEPRSEDGLATWNAFDEGLAVGADFPVLRLPKRPSCPLLTNARTTQTTRAGAPTPMRGGGGAYRWLDTEHFAQVKEGQSFRVHAATGRAEPMASETRDKLFDSFATIAAIGRPLAQAVSTRASFDQARVGAVVEHEGDLYYGKVDGTGGKRLTSTPSREELPEFSPDGKFVAFIRDHDLYVVDVNTGQERALTTGGNDRQRHGQADWVYFEEIFNRRWKAYWWSPDSQHIAFLDIDDRQVPMHHVLIDTGEKRIVEQTAYPRSGDPNPIVKFAIVDVAGGPPRYTDLPEYKADDFLISEVGWWPDSSSAYFYGQDRIQSWLDVVLVPAQGTTPKRLFRETTKAWVESFAPPRVLKDGTFLVNSERDGWKHVYHYNADGSVRRRLTSGSWDVRSIDRVDEEGRWVYFSGTKDDPIAANFYRAKLDGDDIQRLSNGPGSHNVALSPDGGLFIDQFSSRVDPPKAMLRKADGTLVRTLDAGPGETPPSDPKGPRREIARIPTRDGFTLEAEVVLPANLDESGKTLYPVWLMTYGGPHAPTIRESWSGDGVGFGLAQTLVNDGTIVFRVDPRSASGKGAVSTWTAYRKLGVQELEDIKDALAWLKARPYVDGSRIGMSGHSYGGYLTAFCLTHSDLFAAGIAGAPVTDWRDYDSIYTERYMSTPQDNPEGYQASSVVEAAKDLHGKLLVLHGAIDDNVSMRNTMRLVDALQKADKDFELMIYPGSRHGIGGAHYTRLQREFIKRTLGGPSPRP